MKKALFIFCAALALAGCNKGGTGDQYNTETGTMSSRTNNAPIVNTNQALPENRNQSDAVNPSGTATTTDSSAAQTNTSPPPSNP